MATRLAPAVLLAMSVASGTGAPGGGPGGGASDGGADGQPPEEVRTGPEVSGSRSDVSPPLRDLKIAPDPPGQRVHPWRRIPRPTHTPPKESTGTPKSTATQPTDGVQGVAADPQEPVAQPDPRQRMRKKPSRPPRSPRKDQDSAPGDKGGRRSAAKPGAGTNTEPKTKTKESPKPGAGMTGQER
jgi:hypothetical protein